MQPQNAQVTITAIPRSTLGRHHVNEIRVNAQDLARLWALIDRRGPSECWLWRGSVTGSCGVKHGQFTTRIGRRQVSLKAHRVVWVATRGAIPHGQNICHKCDEPRCCNPAHLFLGTQQENLTDARQKGRLREWMPRAPLSLDAYREILLTNQKGIDLARKFGVTETSISRIRNGKQGARAAQLILQDQSGEPEARLRSLDVPHQVDQSLRSRESSR